MSEGLVGWDDPDDPLEGYDPEFVGAEESEGLELSEELDDAEPPEEDPEYPEEDDPELEVPEDPEEDDPDAEDPDDEEPFEPGLGDDDPDDAGAVAPLRSAEVVMAAPV